MTKSKITTATLAALALAGTLAVTSGTAEAHSHWGAGVGIGIAAGALIGAAAATNAYGGPGHPPIANAVSSSDTTAGATCASYRSAATDLTPLGSAPAPSILAPI